MTRFKAVDPLTETADEFRQRTEQSSRPHGSPWLNTEDAAVYLRYTGKHPIKSVYKFIARHRIVTRHDGRRLLMARADLDRVLSLSGTRVSHARHSAARSTSTVSPKSGQGVS